MSDKVLTRGVCLVAEKVVESAKRKVKEKRREGSLAIVDLISLSYVVCALQETVGEILTRDV